MTIPYAERRLCAAVVQKAVQDAQRGDSGAVAWLASHQAEEWLDTLDISQSGLLLHSGWLDWAAVALEGPLSPRQRKVIQHTLTYLEDLN